MNGRKFFELEMLEPRVLLSASAVAAVVPITDPLASALEHSTDPAGPYLPVQNVPNPYQPNLPGNQHFFRVKN